MRILEISRGMLECQAFQNSGFGGFSQYFGSRFILAKKNRVPGWSNVREDKKTKYGDSNSEIHIQSLFDDYTVFLGVSSDFWKI